MKKTYISADELLIDSFKLAKKIVDSGFRPQFIIGVWRGGAPVGIAVQELMDYLGIETDHIAIRTSSYYGIDKQNKEVKVHALDYVIKNVSPGHDTLIVDDVFDSGRSIKAVLDAIHSKARENCPNVIKVACPWYKPSRNVTDIVPDYFLHETEDWLVFPHELNGLTAAEVMEGKGEEIAKLIR